MTWPILSLESLAAPFKGAITDGPFGSNLARQHYRESGPRVVRLQNIGDGVFIDNPAHIDLDHFETLRKHEVIAGDLLVASLGENLPRACLAPDGLGPAIVKADCVRVRLRDDVDPRWVNYSMQRPLVRKWAEQHRHGMGRPRLGLRGIRAIPVPVPPLPEQRWIVDVLEDHLSRLDAALSYADDAHRRAAALKDNLVFRAVTGQDVPGPRKPAELEDLGTHDGDLPDLPTDWSWMRLGDIAEVVGGVTKDAKKQSDPRFVPVPYLRVANVQRGALRLDDVTTIRVASEKAAALRLEPGDVLLNEGGDRDKLARGWVWQGEIDNCIHQNHVFRARISVGLDPYFLSWTANTLGSRWAERNGKQSVNLASISLSMIRKMPVVLPPPGSASELMATLKDRLTAVDRLKDEVAAAERRSRALRRATLAAAFEGKLTGRHTDTEVIEEMAHV